MTKIRILIADDHEVVRCGLKTMLANSEVEVAAEVSTGDAAVKYVMEHPIDVVLLDIRMPGGNGIDFIRPIKAVLAEVIIMLTNYPRRRYERECHERGADYFLDKSRDFSRIPEILARLCENPGPKDATI